MLYFVISLFGRLIPAYPFDAYWRQYRWMELLR
jgi:hypothetical protein